MVCRKRHFIQKIDTCEKMRLANLLKFYNHSCLKNRMYLCLSDANQPTAFSEL